MTYGLDQVHDIHLEAQNYYHKWIRHAEKPRYRDIIYDIILSCQWDMMNCSILVTAILNMQIRPIYRPYIYIFF